MRISRAARRSISSHSRISLVGISLVVAAAIAVPALSSSSSPASAGSVTPTSQAQALTPVSSTSSTVAVTATAPSVSTVPTTGAAATATATTVVVHVAESVPTVVVDPIAPVIADTTTSTEAAGPSSTEPATAESIIPVITVAETPPIETGAAPIYPQRASVNCTVTEPVTGASTGPSADCVTQALASVGLDPQRDGLDVAIRAYQYLWSPPSDGTVGPQTAKSLGITWTQPRPSDRLDIPKISFEHSIITGGQPQINGGNVVLCTGCGFPNISWPGSGTVWLAGHRSSHGSVFARLIELETGDDVYVTHDGVETAYQITSKRLVYRDHPPADAIGGDLVLQTSWYDGQVWLIYGDRA